MQYWQISGRDCLITLETRVEWCDRGNFLAKCFPVAGSPLARDWNEQDGWPRYYMRLEAALDECRLWLEKRGQALEGASWEVHDAAGS